MGARSKWPSDSLSRRGSSTRSLRRASSSGCTRSAIPELVEAALEPGLKPGQRAWVLAMLFAITGHNDPRGDHMFMFGGSDILGSFEFTGDGEGSCRGGKIDPKKQQAFAEKWCVWKTDHYYTVEKQ